MTVLTKDDGAGFLRDLLVTLAADHVEDGLAADDLARRGNERRVTHVGTDAGDFVEDFLDSVCRAHLPKLRD